MDSIEAVDQSSSNSPVDNSAIMMELRSLENSIKDKIKAMWKAGYSYVIICEYAVNALGIQRCSMIMKAIAKIQNILDQINTDLNDFKKLMQELQALGLGKDWILYNPKTGKYTDSGIPVGDGSKPPPGVSVKQQMAYVISEYLKKNNDLGFKDKDGKDIPNWKVFQNIWKDLYGPNANGKGGLIAELKTALNNPWYKQTSNSTKILEALNGNGIYGGDSTSDWTSGVDGTTFVGFMQGNSDSYARLAEALCTAFMNSYYKNNNITPPKGQGITPKDEVGDLTSNVDAVVQSCTALNSTQSSDLSMFAQQLTSLINIVQQMLQQNDKGTSLFVNNQQAK